MKQISIQGTIHINMKQFKEKWIVYSDNVDLYEIIETNKGNFFSTDFRKYIKWLLEFNIYFYTTK